MSVLASIRRRWASRPPADKYLLWAVIGLSAAGILAVYSAISFLAETKSGGDTERFLVRHVARVGLAFAMVGIFSMLDYRKVARFSKLALLCTVGLLIVVKVAGVAHGGAVRFLRYGALGFQPSGLAKVALLLYLGVLLTQKQDYIKNFSRAFAPIFFWILAVVLLIGIEDLSTAAIVLVSAGLMCFVGRMSVVHLSGLTLVGLCLGVLLLLNSPNRAARVEAYLGTDLFGSTKQEEVESMQHEGYQLRQARIAIAMGGLTGVGPGKSVQRDFLPAPYNDFIFAIIVEEYGLVFAVVLLGLFVVILIRGLLRIARHAADPLGLLLGVGFTTMIVLYGFVHAGVATGVLPVTGLPMPFVSYGGTSMVTAGIMIGILLNISRHRR